MATIRYDKLHMEDLPYNRKIVIRYLRAAIHAHLTVMEIEGIEDQLRQQAEFLDPDPEERIKVVYTYPNLAQLKIALAAYDEVRSHIDPQRALQWASTRLNRVNFPLLVHRVFPSLVHGNCCVVSFCLAGARDCAPCE